MTTSRLTPDLVPLDKGLNLQTAKLVAPPGSVLDSLNYEQVDFQGQKRIDGFVRYDGSLGSYQDTFYKLTLNPVSPDIAVGVAAFKNEVLVGIVSGEESGSYILAVIDSTAEINVGDELSIGTVETVEEFKEYKTPEEQYASILTNNAALRARTTELPGPVAGLHWFRDRLYAVASVLKIEVGPDHGYMPNDIYQMPSLADAPVLKVDDEHIYVGVADAETTAGVTSDLGSLFQSRSEQQALDELGDEDLYGWQFLHQGWMVPFEEATSLYGSLPSLNQNIQDVGVQGPTSTTGNNGKALVVKQKVSISGKPAQKNGWKGSDTPSNYSLNAANIAEVDSISIYADAFISWNSTNNTISAPGITGTIPEYSPTNTVQVKV